MKAGTTVKTIAVATGDEKEFGFLRSVLSQQGIEVVQYSAKLPEPRITHAREAAPHLKEVAEHKVRAVWHDTNTPVLSMASGLLIYCLKKFPSVCVDFVLDTIGIEGILKLMVGESTTGRECELRNCLAYYDKSLHVPQVFESSVIGFLSEEPKGKPREEIEDPLLRKLSPVFIPMGKRKTLAEMPSQEYQIFVAEYRIDFCLNRFLEWFSKKE